MLNPLIECYNQCRRGCLASPDSRWKTTLAVGRRLPPESRRNIRKRSGSGRSDKGRTKGGEKTGDTQTCKDFREEEGVKSEDVCVLGGENENGE